MGLHIHVHLYQHPDKDTGTMLAAINQKLDKIMGNQAQHAAELQALTDQVVKSRQEITTKFAELETAITNAGNTTPEVDSALANLKAAVQGIDDLVPDQPTQPGAPETEQPAG